MFDKTNTWCFGRFQVDIPWEAEFRTQGGDFLVAEIESGRGKENFRAAVNAAVDKVKNETFERGFKFERLVYPENDDKQIIVSKADLYGDIAYGLSGFAMNQNKHESNHYYYFSATGYDIEKLDATIAVYQAILSTVRYRHDSEVPAEAGFCIKDGFIPSDGSINMNEDASLAFRLKDRPDVRIRVESSTLWVPEETLLERAKISKLNALLPGNKVKVIRQQKRTVNGMDGEESLISGPSVGEVGTGYIFIWETQGEIGNTLKPGIHLKITAGERVEDSSLSKEQVLALYETVLKSLRFRPASGTAPQPAPAAKP